MPNLGLMISWRKQRHPVKMLKMSAFSIAFLESRKGYLIVQLLSHIWLFVTPWIAACQASLSFTISWSLFKLMSIESMIPSNHLILCHPLFSCPQSFPASGGQNTGASASSFLQRRKEHLIFGNEGDTVTAKVPQVCSFLLSSYWLCIFFIFLFYVCTCVCVCVCVCVTFTFSPGVTMFSSHINWQVAQSYVLQ